MFLYTPPAIRLQRLDHREAPRYGERILPGGDMHKAHLAFRAWASRYDDPSFTGRTLERHELWLSAQTAPILRLQGERPTGDLAQCVAEALPPL
ncbi:hypothetical protein [Rhodospirillum rubrum]|uniref:hypothetical protein n=1 Tax=Rhodospirillum rubrum TaxID=1085 RepID=UPI001F5BD8BF|nr:hypothetical protein [Rhodospirillum rubrum]